MRHLGSTFLALSLLAGCGGSPEQSSEPLAQQVAPLTTTDVDVPPECQGILTFANTATYATLDQYLPSNVASNLVARRATAPFVSIQDLLSVSYMGPARVDQLVGGARSRGLLTNSCVGVLDNLAVSTDDAAAIVSLVNSSSDSELHDVLPDAWNGAVNLLNARPFTTVQAISNTAGIAEKSLRNIRNSATLSRPFEALIAAVNAPPHDNNDATMARHFDWWYVVVEAPQYQQPTLECFGLEPSSYPHGATRRSYVADADEVRGRVQEAVNRAKQQGRVSASVEAAGMANLEARIAGRTFKGCHMSGAPDPWSGHNISIFVDEQNGFSVMVDTYWSE